jgi:hypothetical protein
MDYTENLIAILVHPSAGRQRKERHSVVYAIADVADAIEERYSFVAIIVGLVPDLCLGHSEP